MAFDEEAWFEAYEEPEDVQPRIAAELPTLGTPAGNLEFVAGLLGTLCAGAVAVMLLLTVGAG